MIDDTKSPTSRYGAAFTLEMVNISKYSVSRLESQRWGRLLRFLAFDTQSDPAYTALYQESLAATTEAGPSQATDSAPCVFCRFEFDEALQHECARWDKESCSSCRSWPPFPIDREIREFKIVRTIGVDTQRQIWNCSHYVAVSYCWPQAKYDEKGKEVPYEGSYTVTRNNDTKRNRAPDEVIDRSVAFALENDVRLIWIDQDCINQDDDIDKELGIQSMDIVYQRARFSIGLFNAEIESDEEITAINEFLSWGGRPGSSADVSSLLPFLDGFLDALQRILEDPWTTRAWILQESFSAGKSMVLLFRRGDKVTTQNIGWSGQSCSSTDVAMDLDILNNCITYARYFYTIAEQDKLSRKQLDQFARIGRKLTSFHPMAPESPLHGGRGHETRSRKSCNAAVALSYMQHRYNSRVPDRLAIIANLCDYDLRINTQYVERHVASLATCIFTLAIINGDLSLLYSEFYSCSIPRGGNLSDGLSWVPAIHEILHCLVNSTLDSATRSGGRALGPINLEATGLTIPGTLWKVKNSISLKEIQSEYHEAWSNIVSLVEVNVDPSLPHGHSWWHEMIKLAGGILWDLMATLVDQEELELADAVWHSIRAGYKLPESCSDIIESPYDAEGEMLQLDMRNDGRLRQEWLIERIMNDGVIWYGDRVFGCSEDVVTEESRAGSSKAASKEPLELIESEMNTDDRSDTLDLGQTIEDRTQTSKSIEHNALLKNFMHIICTEALSYEEQKQGEPPSDTVFAKAVQNPNTFVDFISALSQRSPSPGKRRRAFFDVDEPGEEPVLILTPYDARQEKWPRPASRSMSCSWVVKLAPESVVKRNSPEEFSTDRETFKTLGMVKGMWKLVDSDHNSFRVS